MPASLTPAASLVLTLTLLWPTAFCTAQQHTTDSPTLLEGPQKPGTPTLSSPASPAKVLSNDSILRMHAAGLSDELIVQTVNTQPGSYTLDPDSLIQLKQAGISDSVMEAMTGARARRPLSGADIPPAPIALAEVNEIGVYYKNKDGRWTYIDPELVHVQGGGFWKHTLTNGVIKQDKNGSLLGRESKLLLPRPIEFLIYAPEGVSGSEYELLRFRLNSGHREFRILTGGVFNSHGGAERDDVPFTLTKAGPRAWSFTVDRTTPGGEYGILPPATGNVTNAGKIYTFAISE